MNFFIITALLLFLLFTFQRRFFPSSVSTTAFSLRQDRPNVSTVDYRVPANNGVVGELQALLFREACEQYNAPLGAFSEAKYKIVASFLRRFNPSVLLYKDKVRTIIVIFNTYLDFFRGLALSNKAAIDCHKIRKYIEIFQHEREKIIGRKDRIVLFNEINFEANDLPRNVPVEKLNNLKHLRHIVYPLIFELSKVVQLSDEDECWKPYRCDTTAVFWYYIFTGVRLYDSAECQWCLEEYQASIDIPMDQAWNKILLSADRQGVHFLKLLTSTIYSHSFLILRDGERAHIVQSYGSREIMYPNESLPQVTDWRVWRELKQELQRLVIGNTISIRAWSRLFTKKKRCIPRSTLSAIHHAFAPFEVGAQTMRTMRVRMHFQFALNNLLFTISGLQPKVKVETITENSPVLLQNHELSGMNDVHFCSEKLGILQRVGQEYRILRSNLEFERVNAHSEVIPLGMSFVEALKKRNDYRLR